MPHKTLLTECCDSIIIEPEDDNELEIKTIYNNFVAKINHKVKNDKKCSFADLELIFSDTVNEINKLIQQIKNAYIIN